jgi:hypothetical protein
MYDSSILKWRIVKRLGKGLKAHQALALPDGIYILGGFDGQYYLNTLFK